MRAHRAELAERKKETVRVFKRLDRKLSALEGIFPSRVFSAALSDMRAIIAAGKGAA